MKRCFAQGHPNVQKRCTPHPGILFRYGCARAMFITPISRSVFEDVWSSRWIYGSLGSWVRSLHPQGSSALPRQSLAPLLASARCLLIGIGLPPSITTFRVTRSITFNTLPPISPHHLLGWEHNHILHPRSVLITPQVTVPLDHGGTSNPLQTPHRRETLLCSRRRRRHQVHAGVLRATSNTNLSSIRPVDPCLSPPLRPRSRIQYNPRTCTSRRHPTISRYPFPATRLASFGLSPLSCPDCHTILPFYYYKTPGL